MVTYTHHSPFPTHIHTPAFPTCLVHCPPQFIHTPSICSHTFTSPATHTHTPLLPALYLPTCSLVAGITYTHTLPVPGFSLLFLCPSASWFGWTSTHRTLPHHWFPSHCDDHFCLHLYVHYYLPPAYDRTYLPARYYPLAHAHNTLPCTFCSPHPPRLRAAAGLTCPRCRLHAVCVHLLHHYAQPAGRHHTHPAATPTFRFSYRPALSYCSSPPRRLPFRVDDYTVLRTLPHVILPPYLPTFDVAFYLVADVHLPCWMRYHRYPGLDSGLFPGPSPTAPTITAAHLPIHLHAGSAAGHTPHAPLPHIRTRTLPCYYPPSCPTRCLPAHTFLPTYVTPWFTYVTCSSHAYAPPTHMPHGYLCCRCYYLTTCFGISVPLLRGYRTTCLPPVCHFACLLLYTSSVSACQFSPPPPSLPYRAVSSLPVVQFLLPLRLQAPHRITPTPPQLGPYLPCLHTLPLHYHLLQHLCYCAHALRHYHH